MKAKERKELEEELKLKEQELEETEIRLSGGFSKTLKRDVIAIGTEINRMLRIIEMKTIELQYDRPITPKFDYEANERYRQLAREFMKEDLDKFKEVLDRVINQKKEIDEKLPKLTERIEEIKNILGR